jgi:ribonuclease HII
VNLKKPQQFFAPDCSFELPYWNDGKIVAGIDEAGRGPLAGPVVAAAVIFKSDPAEHLGINDSKKLSEKKREELFELIPGLSLAVGIGIVDHLEIDKINILQATQKAMRIAAENLKIKPDHLLVDGNYFKEFGISYETIVKGDGRSLSIAAASIIAKVTRDRWMTETADKLYPGYGFARHKGYGTKAHYEALDKLGISPIHRLSFLKKYLNQEPRLF